MIARAAKIPAAAFVLGVSWASLGAAHARAEPYSKVYVNGTPVPVFFNDGDSFRIQAGPLRGVQARLNGYNTLESFGPAHSWGTWTSKEMYAIAKLATHVARKGVWNCEGDGSKDGYGRLLLFCKDLAVHLIREGLAHAYSVDANPAHPELLAAQHKAIRERKGIWSHGVPRYVMTSLHSKDEGGDRNGVTSNRLISTWDGHSEKWVHEDNYKECQKVCNLVPDATDADLEALVEKLKSDAEVGASVRAMNAGLLRASLRTLVEAFLRTGAVTTEDLAALGLALPAGLSAQDAGLLAKGLARITDGAVLELSGKREDSCMVHVDFKRRFGGDRAACLR